MLLNIYFILDEPFLGSLYFVPVFFQDNLELSRILHDREIGLFLLINNFNFSTN